MNNLENIYSKEFSESFTNPFLLNDNLLKDKDHDLANIFYYNDYTPKVLILNNYINHPKFEIETQEEAPKEFCNQINNVISDYLDVLRNEENLIFDEEKIKKKKYLENAEIQNDLLLIKDISFIERKALADKEFLNINKKIGIKEKYLSYIKILIKDNTEKEIIQNYLIFLKQNQSELQKIKYLEIELYESELEDYKVMFTQKELSKFNEKKDKSEKEELIDFLKELREHYNKIIKDKKISIEFADFIRYIKEKSQKIIFNQPIPFKNKELFYFKCRANLYQEFNYIKLYKDNSPNIALFEIKHYVIDKILNNNIFEKAILNENEDKMNLLITSIIYPTNKIEVDYAINLLTCEKTKSNEEIMKEINNLEYKFKEEEYKEICINNVKLINKLKLEKFQLFNYDYQKKIHMENAKKIKEFLKKILKLNVFDEAFKLLYGKDFKNIFKNDAFVEIYFDKYVNFVPFYFSNTSGITDKFTLKTYIFLKRNIIIEETNDQTISEFAKKALKLGSYLEIELHEINHFIYALLFMHDRRL